MLKDKVGRSPSGSGSRASRGARKRSPSIRTSIPIAALEAGEDVLADAIKSGTIFGVRCGCPQCDANAWQWVRKIYEAVAQGIVTGGEDPKGLREAEGRVEPGSPKENAP